MLKAAAAAGPARRARRGARGADRHPPRRRRHHHHLPREGCGPMAHVARAKVRSRKDGAAVPLDDIDKQLLNLMQGSFPLDARPFTAVAELAGLTEDEVLERVQYLLDKRIIREITPIFDTRAFGYRSMLVAAKVDPALPAPRGAVHQHASGRHAQLPARPRLQPVVHDRGRARLEARPRRHARRDRGEDRRRVDPPAADAEALQDPHGPRDGGRHRRAEHRGRGRGADGARADRAERGGHRDGPRHAGRRCRSSPSPTRPRPSGSACRRSGARAPRSLRERGGLRRVAAILYHRRAGFSANGMGVWAVPDARSSRPASGWPRSAASRTATSGRPTATGPTPSSRWPTGAPRRSATRSSTRSPTTTGIEQRATLYSSTEFKKVRMLYFTDAFKRWEQEHGS